MLKNQRIIVKLGMAFGILILLLAVLGLTGYRGMQSTYSSTARTLEANDINAFALEKEIDHLKWMASLAEFAEDPEARRLAVEIDHTQCSLGKFLYGEGRRQAEDLVPSLVPIFAAMEAPHERLHASARDINGARHQRDEAQVHAIRHTETVPSMVAVQKRLGQVQAEVAQYKSDNQADLIRSIKGNQTLILTLAASAILVGVLATVGISRAIVPPICKSVEMAERISSGDLTATLAEERRDELGQLAEALNSMVRNLRKVIADISSGVGTVSESSSELSAISTQMSTGATQTTAQAKTVAAASEQLSANAQSVATAMEQTSTNVRMVSSAAEEMTATINEIAQNTERARDITTKAVTEAQNASGQVGELGEAAESIGQVIETITDISEQVNLLALNATIEAARAGEAGKGFAVVANEIKELARQTAEATGEIKTRIEGIQTRTTGAVQGIAHITRVVNDINDIVAGIATSVEEQSITTREIAENVSQAAGGIGEVNENMAQSATATRNIAHEIAHVEEGSAEMTESSRQISDRAQELSKLAEMLRAMVGRFKV